VLWQTQAHFAPAGITQNLSIWKCRLLEIAVADVCLLDVACLMFACLMFGGLMIGGLMFWLLDESVRQLPSSQRILC